MEGERRNSARHTEDSLLLTLLRLDGGQEVDAFVRNLSLTGMMVEPLFGEGLSQLSPGAHVRCIRPPLHLDVLKDVAGSVRWSRGEAAGLSFDAPLPLDDTSLSSTLEASGIASWEDLLDVADQDPALAFGKPAKAASGKRRARTPAKRKRKT